MTRKLMERLCLSDAMAVDRLLILVVSYVIELLILFSFDSIVKYTTGYV